MRLASVISETIKINFTDLQLLPYTHEQRGARLNNSISFFANIFEFISYIYIYEIYEQLMIK